MVPLRVRRILVGLLIGLIIMTVVGMVSYTVPDQQVEEVAQIAQANEVLGQLAGLTNRLADAETGQREFLLSGQAYYRRLHAAALKGLDGELDKFQQLTKEEPRQRAQLRLLRNEIAAGLAEMKRGIELRSANGNDGGITEPLIARSRFRMDVIQRQLDQMTAEEQRVLQQRTARWQATAIHTRWVFVGEGALLCVLLGVVYIILQQEAAERKRRKIVEFNAAEAARKEAERLALLVTSQSSCAGAVQDLQATMQSLTERAREITRAAGAVVELVEGEDLVCRAACGTMASDLGHYLNRSTTLSGLSVRKNAVLHCEDAEKDDRLNAAACRKVAVQSMVSAPMRQNGHVVGALTVTSPRPHGFCQLDLAVVELMAGLLSTAGSDAAAAETVRRSQQRLSEAQQAAQVGSWEFDPITGKSMWSAGMFRIAGMPQEGAEPDYAAITALFAREDSARLSGAFESAMRKSIGFAMELQQAAAKGEAPRYFQATAKPVTNSRGKVVRVEGTFTDISERKRFEAEIQEAYAQLAEAKAQYEKLDALLEEQYAALAEQAAKLEETSGLLEVQTTTDELTGLRNHRALQERLSEEHIRAQRYGIPLSVVMLDIDRFKQFNDAYGPPAGDEVLKRVAAIVLATARTTDVVVRYSGGTFAVLLVETDARGAVDAAERIRHAIACAEWKERAVTVSVGAATLDAGTDNASQLLRAADVALFQSKTQGRNCVTHTGGPQLVSDATATQAAGAYRRRFNTRLGDERPSRRLLEGAGRAA